MSEENKNKRPETENIDVPGAVEPEKIETEPSEPLNESKDNEYYCDFKSGTDEAVADKSKSKKTTIPLKVFLLALVAAIIFSVSITHTVLEYTYNKALDYYISNGAIPSKGEFDKYIAIVKAITSSASYYDVSEEKVLESVLDAYVKSTGDKYADYYTKAEVEAMMAENQGEMVGIGVNVIYNVDLKMIEVINVMPDSPALEADVRIGDMIAYVGSGEERVYVPDTTYEVAVDKMIGEEGTKAEFTVLRGENYSETVDFSIERRKITTQSVMYHVCATDAKVGIVRISEFDLTTPPQFTEAIDTLKAEGCEKFVLDVRNNPGGYAISVEAVLSYFLSEGDPIIYTVDTNGDESFSSASPVRFAAPYDTCNISKSDIGKYSDLDVVVIANEYTASAGELFTATIQQYGVGKFVGTQTYGKGSMQTTYYLDAYGLDGAIKMTTHMYFPKDKVSYEGKGIEPDHKVEIAEELKNVSIYKYTDAEDNQLQYAISVMYGTNQ